MVLEIQRRVTRIIFIRSTVISIFIYLFFYQLNEFLQLKNEFHESQMLSYRVKNLNVKVF